MHKASLLFIFEPNPGLESSMSTLRSGPRSPRSPGPRAPSRASYPLIFSKSFFFMLHQINFYCSILSAYLMR